MVHCRSPLALIAALTLVSMVSPPATTAGPNANTTLVLHALPTSFGPCQIEDPCDPGPPSVSAPPNTMVAIYVIARNYDDIKLIQLALAWGDWDLLYGLFDCLPGQWPGCIGPTNPGGPTRGTISTIFDCIVGGESAIVARLHYLTGSSGCVDVIESSFPFGNHALSCGNEVDHIDAANWGRVCIGAGGVDACEPASIPVDATTWGAIKCALRSVNWR
jgi:hypothetical protein